MLYWKFYIIRQEKEIKVYKLEKKKADYLCMYRKLRKTHTHNHLAW